MFRTRFSLATLATLILAVLPVDRAIAQKPTPAYTFTALPGLSSTQSEATAVNDSGQVVGYSNAPFSPTYGSKSHPVVWAKNATGNYVITDLNPVARMSGSATGINSQGEVVGYVADWTGVPEYSFLIRPVVVNGNKVWYQDLNNDGLNDLMTNLGDFGYPGGISDNTQIVANSYVVQFDNTGREFTATLPGNGIGHAINSNRLVAGEANGVTAPNQPAVWQVDAAGNALSMTTLAPLSGYTSGAVGGINALGQSAGFSSYTTSSGSQVLHATLWPGSSAPIDLGTATLPPYDPSGPPPYVRLGINTVNGALQVVWNASTSNGSRAFLLKNGVKTDLNTLISARGVVLNNAVAINANGQIVGSASVTVSGSTTLHGYILSPN